MTTNKMEIVTGSEKAAWARPEFKRFEAGAAESQESGSFDAGNPQRS